jgi:hypothetical protein
MPNFRMAGSLTGSPMIVDFYSRQREPLPATRFHPRNSTVVLIL